MSKPEKELIATIRDRLKDEDRVYLTRGLNVFNEQDVKRKYPAGEYAAVDLPAIAYQEGLVIEVQKVPDPDPQKKLTQVVEVKEPIPNAAARDKK